MTANEHRTGYRRWPLGVQIALVVIGVVWMLALATWLVVHREPAYGIGFVIPTFALIAWTHLQWVPPGSRLSLQRDGASVEREQEDRPPAAPSLQSPSCLG